MPIKHKIKDPNPISFFPPDKQGFQSCFEIPTQIQNKKKNQQINVEGTAKFTTLRAFYPFSHIFSQPKRTFPPHFLDQIQTEIKPTKMRTLLHSDSRASCESSLKPYLSLLLCLSPKSQQLAIANTRASTMPKKGIKTAHNFSPNVKELDPCKKKKKKKNNRQAKNLN